MRIGPRTQAALVGVGVVTAVAVVGGTVAAAQAHEPNSVDAPDLTRGGLTPTTGAPSPTPTHGFTVAPGPVVTLTRGSLSGQLVCRSGRQIVSVQSSLTPISRGPSWVAAGLVGAARGEMAPTTDAGTVRITVVSSSKWRVTLAPKSSARKLYLFPICAGIT